MFPHPDGFNPEQLKEELIEALNEAIAQGDPLAKEFLEGLEVVEGAPFAARHPLDSATIDHLIANALERL